jgi:hypothetical protein
MSDEYKYEPKDKRPTFYIERGGEPVAIADVMAWAMWMEDKDARRVALTQRGDVRVSTVFLGIDHAWGEGMPPLLYETMVFNGPHDGTQRRYSTREEALVGHRAMVEKVMGEPPADPSSTPPPVGGRSPEGSV